MERPSAGEAGRGTSLVEVVIALALLAALLVSMAGLLHLGGRQVAGGARASQGLALAQAILEELELDGYHRVFARFGCEGGARECRVASGQAALEAWQVRAAAHLPGARIEIHIEAIGAAKLEAAPALRVTVALAWREGLRFRSLRLTTVRV